MLKSSRKTRDWPYTFFLPGKSKYLVSDIHKPAPIELGLLTIINSWEATKKIELSHSIEDLSVDLCRDVWNNSDLCIICREA